ncbi:MAG: hypothetical protein D6706_20320, partial [Chloroflexi bacterium]
LALRHLQTNGFRYILVHRPYLTPPQASLFTDTLPLIPTYQDEALTVYDITQPRPWQFGQPAIKLTDQIYLLNTITTLDKTAETLHIRLITQLTQAPTPSLTCQLALGNNTTSLTLYPTDILWQTGDLADYRLSLPLPVTTGQYNWQLHCPQTTYTTPTTLVISPTHSSLLFREQLNINLADELTLLGYHWQTQTDTLQLTLHWQANTIPTTDYKLFVHLLDNTNQIVRQYDAMPCNWQCPTTTWQPNSVLTEEITLPLWGLSAGTYHLAAGMYQPENGERLPAVRPDNTPIPDGYIILNTPITIYKNR